MVFDLFVVVKICIWMVAHDSSLIDFGFVVYDCRCFRSVVE